MSVTGFILMQFFSIVFNIDFLLLSPFDHVWVHWAVYMVIGLIKSYCPLFIEPLFGGKFG